MAGPKDADAYSARGNAHDMLGQPSRALDDFNVAIALSPSNAKTYFSRGMIYYKKGDLGRAISDFQKACDMGIENGCKLVR